MGGGMITQDQLLPSLYHIQRQGRIGGITVCARTAQTLETLAASPVLARAFPGRCFKPSTDPYAEALSRLPDGSIVVAAVPDHLHYEVIMTALRLDQHVLAVKPLVLRYSQAREIEREAFHRGLLVGIDYHKRYDDRSLLARTRYREGRFGEFRLGSACLLEKWFYRQSNFQNWMTVENSDSFTYIGCHYVDLVRFITGLEPTSVSVYGVRDRFPNGHEGYLWTDARVIWENGACLNVQNGLCFPDQAPGTNTQGLVMYCAGRDGGALISHSDQYRGLKYAYASNEYAEPSPDYFQYVDMGADGLTPVGYGFRSIEHIVAGAIEVESAPSLEERRRLLEAIDRAGIMATPANSSANERVIEAGRASILSGGRVVEIGGR